MAGVLPPTQQHPTYKTRHGDGCVPGSITADLARLAHKGSPGGHVEIEAIQSIEAIVEIDSEGVERGSNALVKLMSTSDESICWLDHLSIRSEGESRMGSGRYIMRGL